jgi:hypothetical protein
VQQLGTQSRTENYDVADRRQRVYVKEVVTVLHIEYTVKLKVKV